MYYYLNGEIGHLDLKTAVIDCGGVGYACHTSNYTLARRRRLQVRHNAEHLQTDKRKNESETVHIPERSGRRDGTLRLCGRNGKNVL